MRDINEIKRELEHDIEDEKTSVAKTALCISIEAKTIELLGTIAYCAGISPERIESIMAMDKSWLLNLPKEGDIIYEAGNGDVYPYRIESISIVAQPVIDIGEGTEVEWQDTAGPEEFLSSEVGKTLFLSEYDAWKAAEERNSADDQ